MTEAVIVAGRRSPVGRAYKGSLATVRADDLLVAVIRDLLSRAPGLDGRDLDDVIVGCGLPGGEQGMNIARVATVLLGLDNVPGTTVTRYCASSLESVRMAFHAIRAGEGDAYVCAGVESISRAAVGNADRIPGLDVRNPAFASAMIRSELAEEFPQRWTDPRHDGELPDVYIAMGQTAENVADICGVTRDEQDEWAARSQNRAEAAGRLGYWDEEIVPITLPDGTVVRSDDSPRAGVTATSLAALEPVFRAGGTVTAGNCCPLNDGAAALLVMSEHAARAAGLRPLARIVSSGLSALSPEIMGLGTIEASRKALARADLRADDLDAVEVNEAFAAQVIPTIKQLGLSSDRVNVNGGAIALGHPFGMTGARMVLTLLHTLRERDGRWGMATMCVGGGQGSALVIERYQ